MTTGPLLPSQACRTLPDIRRLWTAQMWAATATSICHSAHRYHRTGRSKILFASFNEPSPRWGGLVGNLPAVAWGQQQASQGHQEWSISSSGSQETQLKVLLEEGNVGSSYTHEHCKSNLHLRTPKGGKTQCMTDGKPGAALHQAEFERVLQCLQRVCSAARLTSRVGRTARIYLISLLSAPDSIPPSYCPLLAPVWVTSPIPI